MNVGTVDDQSVLKYHISVAAKIAEGCKKRRLKSGHFFVQRLTLNKSLINILQTYLEKTFVKSPIAQKLKRREGVCLVAVPKPWGGYISAAPLGFMSIAARLF